MYKIISYFTPNYKNIAEKYIIPSVNKLELDNYIIEVPDLHSWKANTNYKAYFVKECLEKFNSSLVFIDADATVNYNPILFNELDNKDIDFAYHLLSWEIHYGRPKDVGKFQFASGTLFFKNNKIIKNLIDKWIEISKKIYPDQKSLEKAYNEHRNELNTMILPREYLYINTQPNGEPPSIPLDNPVVVHHQISREIKNEYRK